MEISDSLIALAKTGISGFALYTCYLSFKLISDANESSNHRLIYGYMAFSLILALIVLSWQIIDVSTDTTKVDKACPINTECMDINTDFFLPQNIQVYKNGDFVDSTVPGKANSPFTAEEAMVKLHQGYKPRYLIRFINGDLITGDAIRNGSAWLGEPNKKVVFAADYDELKGLPLTLAIDRVGGLELGSSVAVAIINTSLNGGVKVNPASLRGIYKWVRDLNSQSNFYPKITMPTDESVLSDIYDHNGMRFHGLDKWRGLYDSYESSFKEIRFSNEFESSFSEIDYNEWDDYGFSSQNSGHGETIMIDNKAKYNYGSLSFLVENIPLRDLNGVIIVKLNKTNSNEIIPILNN